MYNVSVMCVEVSAFWTPLRWSYILIHFGHIFYYSQLCTYYSILLLLLRTAIIFLSRTCYLRISVDSVTSNLHPVKIFLNADFKQCFVNNLKSIYIPNYMFLDIINIKYYDSMLCFLLMHQVQCMRKQVDYK